MARFCGIVAFNTEVNKGSGITEQEVVEKKYYGELLQYRQSISNGPGINDNVNLSNKISILVDTFAMKNFPSILYVELNGAKWKVSSVEPEYPRLILTTGGVYNA